MSTTDFPTLTKRNAGLRLRSVLEREPASDEAPTDDTNQTSVRGFIDILKRDVQCGSRDASLPD